MLKYRVTPETSSVSSSLVSSPVSSSTVIPGRDRKSKSSASSFKSLCTNTRRFHDDGDDKNADLLYLNRRKIDHTSNESLNTPHTFNSKSTLATNSETGSKKKQKQHREVKSSLKSSSIREKSSVANLAIVDYVAEEAATKDTEMNRQLSCSGGSATKRNANAACCRTSCSRKQNHKFLNHQLVQSQHTVMRNKSMKSKTIYLETRKLKILIFVFILKKSNRTPPPFYLNRHEKERK